MQDEATLDAEVLDTGIEVEELEERSMDDTIREALAKMSAPETPETPTDSRVRDESGRFAKQEVAPTEPVAEQPPEPVAPPPNTWKKEAASEWAKLPPLVQQEVARREADFHKGIEQYKSAAQFAQVVGQAIQPHLQTMQQLGVAPEQAISELLNADAKLRYSPPEQKVQYLAQLAQAYGIDIGQLQNYQPAPVDSTVSALQQQVQQLQQYLTQQQMMGRQQEDESLHSEIARFAADPSHSHFDAVREHMVALLNAGLANSLEDAYEQAVNANRNTRTLVAQQQAQREREEAAKAAKAAREAASVNVRSRSSVVPVEPAAGQTMDDTIKQTLARLRAG